MKSFAFLLLLAASVVAQQAPSPNDQARFLAGLPVRESALEPWSHDRAYVEHATFLDDAWRKKEQRSLSKVRGWAATYAAEAYRDTGTMYYMFSGPDFLYAHTFFPNASTYILCGTEPIGAVPDITRLLPGALDASLADLRKALNTMLSFHYFIAKEMRTDLQRGQLGGTLPVLYVFLARLGCTIHQVSPVSRPSPGVKITFGGPAGQPQTLFYFKTDLSNGSSGPFLRWCAQQGPGMSLLKAASYLMHTDGFSNVRSFLIENSRILVQDDSGIPLRALDERWRLRFFGNYVAPIELFQKHYQPDLAAVYARSNPAELGFAFGYHWQPDRGMLMLGFRK